MEIIKNYKSGDENIVIKKYNRGLVICYNYDYKSCSYVGHSAYYDTIEEAEKMLFKHRPDAVTVKV